MKGAKRKLQERNVRLQIGDHPAGRLPAIKALQGRGREAAAPTAGGVQQAGLPTTDSGPEAAAPTADNVLPQGGDRQPTGGKGAEGIPAE